MDIYTEDILDHYENPRNQGEIEGEDVLTVRDANASCGDMIQFFVKIKANKRTSEQEITDVKWKGLGCAVSTASASKLSEWLKGKTLQDIRKLGEQELVEKGVGFSVNPGREKCLMLPVGAIKRLLDPTPKA